jgi:Cu-Zn family superoxide dismutase
MASRAIAAAFAATLIAGAARAAPATVTAELKNSTGQTVGGVTLSEAPKGILMRIDVKGLSPGWHGLHFHEKGDCSKSDFTSAGAHVHGAGASVHGLLNPAGNELGDLPNIHAGADGAASAEVFTTLTALSALRDTDGSAVVIHANPDDQMAQPIGGAGARVACAVIK